jgi:hypothetical protein
MRESTGNHQSKSRRRSTGANKALGNLFNGIPTLNTAGTNVPLSYPRSPIGENKGARLYARTFNLIVPMEVF